MRWESQQKVMAKEMAMKKEMLMAREIVMILQGSDFDRNMAMRNNGLWSSSRDDSQRKYTWRSSHLDDPQHMTHGEMMIHRDGSMFLRYTHFTDPNLISLGETWHSAENPSHPTADKSRSVLPRLLRRLVEQRSGHWATAVFLFRVSFSQGVGPKSQAYPQLDPLIGGSYNSSQKLSRLLYSPRGSKG